MLDNNNSGVTQATPDVKSSHFAGSQHMCNTKTPAARLKKKKNSFESTLTGKHMSQQR